MASKTEKPTPRRLRKAIEEGDSGASTAFAQAVGFVVAVALLPSAVGVAATRVASDLKSAIASAPRNAMPVWSPWGLAESFLAIVAPLLLSTAIASALAMLAQTGGVLSTKRVIPDFARLNLARGLGALFSPMRAFSVLRSLIAGLAVAWLAASGIRAAVGDLCRLPGHVQSVAVVVSDLARTLVWRAAFVGLVLGLLDLVVVRHAWIKRLSMTPDEVKREHRENEGDPAIKAARHHAYQELLAQVEVSAVRSARVVVVNPTHVACALRYDATEGGDDAPVVVAAGEGELAARIVQAARDYGVPVVRDVPLARALLELAVGDAIPEALYEAVAEVLREIMEHEDSPSTTQP